MNVDDILVDVSKNTGIPSVGLVAAAGWVLDGWIADVRGGCGWASIQWWAQGKDWQWCSVADKILWIEKAKKHGSLVM